MELILGVALVLVLILLLLVYAAHTGALGFAPGGAVQRAGEPDELVVATFNIRNGLAWDGSSSWVFRSRSTGRAARALGADILAVQEAYSFQNRFLRSSLSGYRLVGRGRGVRGGEWCTIYVRRDRLRILQVTTRWFGDDPERPGSRLPGASFPRIGTHARLVVEPDGAAFEVVNTHLDERDADNRRRSVEQLVEWLDPAVPRVVVGDLNATWEREPDLFAVLTSAGLSDALPRDAGGTTHGFRGVSGKQRIDHIFVSGEWEVVESHVVVAEQARRLPSDHWPVVATLRLR